MIIDTNIFVRYFTQDIPSLYKKARALFEKVEKGKQEIFVSILVINELIWILKKFYNLDRDIYLPQLLQVLSLNNVTIMETDKEIMLDALGTALEKPKIDFTDIYLFTIAKGREIFSFDKDFKKLQKQQNSN